MMYSYPKIAYNSVSWDAKYKKEKKWVVTEKVHGANFSVIYDVNQTSIKYAKRTGILQDNDSFFGYMSIVPALLPQIELIKHLISSKYTSINTFIVYGELFGGIYPDVQPNTDPAIKQVQNGIFYSPNLHFYAFDICIIDSIENRMHYIPYNISAFMFKTVGMMHAEPLQIYSSYESAIEHALGFNSTIPAKLNMPEILIINKAEGIVVRNWSGINRYIVKIKIPEFSESIYSKNKYISNTADITDYNYKNKATNCITLNRLNAAISKIGNFKDNKDEIHALFVYDILDEIGALHMYKITEWVDIQVQLFMQNMV